MNVVLRNQQKAEAFSALFQHIKLFTEHVNIMFEKDHMYLQSMDSSRVSIFEIKLESSWFDTYEHTHTTSIPIGVSSSLLFKILNTRDKMQELQLVFAESESDKLFINFTCDNKAVFDKKFELPLVDLEYELMAIPDSESQAEISINSVNFANIINQMKMFGDTLEFECDEEKIMMYSISQESGKMSVEINIDDLTGYSINEGESIKLSFSLNVLHNICMYSKIAKDVEVRLTENFPMKITYLLGDENSKMVFYLAPKISDD
jgi:proliferating cell nuclear antigen